MKPTRRQFMSNAAAVIGGISVMPYTLNNSLADGHAFMDGKLTVHPVSHASFVMKSPIGTIYVDPVGDASAYSEFGTPDLVLITHQHGDHYNEETLNAIVGDNTKLITNPAVHEMLLDGLKAKNSLIANGGSATFEALNIDAIPAHNLTEERLHFHPKGRDNGYVLGFEGFRVYISGDTEDVPEMRALKDIDLAFVCMNLPFTMDAKTAASAVAEFKPKHVYPYHYRGKDGGTQDPEEFAKLVGDAAEVTLGKWYG